MPLGTLMYGFDWMFFVIIGIFIISMVVQSKVNSTFKNYNKVLSKKNITGAQVSKQLLQDAGVYDVEIETNSGPALNNFYDPRKKVVSLSNEVYNSTSVASIGIAAHECGHAIQHEDAYVFLKMREVIMPVVKVASFAAPILFFIGFFMQLFDLLFIGLILFGVTTLFYFITLPVEYNASSRAIEILRNGNFLDTEELSMSKNVLSAAALTYVMAAIQSLAQLLRMLMLSGRRRR